MIAVAAPPGDLAGQPLYLDLPEPVFAVLHRAPADVAGGSAVVLCPPFGWPEVSSYRARREWAVALAAAGHPTLRLILPGTGDSAGAPVGSDRLSAWTETVKAAVAAMRATLGTTRCAVIGIGPSGLLALRAAAEGAAIEELVLWSTPARGRSVLRELRALSRVESERYWNETNQPPPLPEGAIEVGGFLVSAETADALGALDFRGADLSGSSLRRVLLLGRDGVPADRDLADTLSAAGIELAEGAGDGYAAMMSHPQQAQLPVRLRDEVTRWLDAGAAPAVPGDRGPRPDAIPSAPRLVQSLRLPDTGVVEWPLRIELDTKVLAGIVTEPVGEPSPLCAVFANAGAIYRIGPGRMWVDAARRWAARGVRTIRFDISGIGDADGPPAPYGSDFSLYEPELTEEVLGALRFFAQRGFGEQFAVGGLCSGAYWAFEAALRDPLVVSAYLLNARMIVWNAGVLATRDLRRGVLRPRNWRKLHAIPRERYLNVVRWGLATPTRLASTATSAGRGRSRGRAVDTALDAVRDQGKRLLFVFSDDEPMYEELEHDGQIAKLARWPNVTLERVTGHDHSLRPLHTQRQAHAALDRALERDLAALADAGGAAQASPAARAT